MPSQLKSIFNQLKTSIVGTKTMSIDAKLDSTIKNLGAYRTNIGRNSYLELVKNLISKTGFDIQASSFSQSSAVSPAMMGQSARLMRYKSYEGIVSNINYCSRALNVLVDNILSPDDITKTSLVVSTDAPNTDEEESIQTFIKDIEKTISKIKIEQHLEEIVKNTLEFGDFFCEVSDTKTALTSYSSILTESSIFTNIDVPTSSPLELTVNYEATDERLNKTYDITRHIKINQPFLKDRSVNTEDDKHKKSSHMTDADIQLVYYDAKRVVKLQSDIYPVCFGYLVFPLIALNPGLAIQNQSINTICSSILRKLSEKVPELKEGNIDTDDLKSIVTAMLKNTDATRAMNIRYVPPERMVHFRVPSTKFFPYGESIFDSSVFISKLIIMLETALTIYRINRSTEKRKISVELGLPRDAKTAVENIKEEFRKRKVSVDSFGTVDTIPSHINTFEDIYIPTKDGKAFVDIDTFNAGAVDTRGKVDEIKLLRDQLIAGLGVPPSFIGLEENLSNKSALSEENILFARTVIKHQKYFSAQIKTLITKILNIIDPEKTSLYIEDITIALPTPKSLQFEREAKYTTDLANLITTLDGLGIPREWAKKKYLAGLDWEDIKQQKIEDKIDKNMRIKRNEPGELMDDNGMGMGAAGGMMGGMPMGGGTPGY